MASQDSFGLLNTLYFSPEPQLHTYFEKIPFEQYKKDRKQDERDSALEYIGITIPVRQTEKSAGYDIETPIAFTIKRGESIKIPTGICAHMQDDEVLKVYIRSSLAWKHDITLSNNVGIIDADFVESDRHGHIWVKLINLGQEDVSFEANTRIAQGIFEKFIKTCDDTPVNAQRKGGMGSTDKEA